MEFILASGSPRRKKMLTELGVSFRSASPDIEEIRLRGEPAVHFVKRLARQKAEAAALKLGYLKEVPTCSVKISSQMNCRRVFESFKDQKEKFTEKKEDWAILTADTIVVYGKTVLGKPKNHVDALSMLKRLSGKTHEVMTAYCWFGSVKNIPRICLGMEKTKVSFAKRSKDFWKWYISTGEPMDKAGSYAAQGIGMSFIEKVQGSYSNVVGLPLPGVLSCFTKTFGGDLRELVRTTN